MNLARHIQEGLAQVAVMRLGIASIGFGTTLIAAGVAGRCFEPSTARTVLSLEMT